MPVDKCKLPAYTPDNPRLWFVLVEAAFVLHKVTKSEEQTALVLSGLPPAQLMFLAPLLETSVYALADIKDSLLRKDAPCAQEAFGKMIRSPPLSPGQKPSDYLVSMTSWIPDQANRDSFFTRLLFIDKMPESMKSMLISKDDLSLQELSLFANSIVAAEKKHPVCLTYPPRQVWTKCS